MSTVIQSVEAQVVDLENRKSKLTIKANDYDRQILKFYHELEDRDFDATEGYNIAKELQKLLRERRKLKFESVQVGVLMKELKNAIKNLKKNELDYFKGSTGYTKFIK